VFLANFPFARLGAPEEAGLILPDVPSELTCELKIRRGLTVVKGIILRRFSCCMGVADFAGLCRILQM
jgi:hypothetical protein